MRNILDFILGICQTKKLNYLLLFLTLLVSSCAKKEVVIETIRPTGTWFSTKEKFHFKNYDGNPESHLFFDFKPVLNVEKKLVDAVVITPEKSKFHYDFDLVSGKRYFSHEYCDESDVWKSYEPPLTVPPYTEAIIPRLLDQVKKPQRVIVFGDKKYLTSDRFPQDETVRVRVIGGMLEQYCNRFPCDNDKKWDSRLLLFAVSPLDPEYRDIHSFGKLIKKVDWKEVKAFIENGRGSSKNGTDVYPAYRLIGQVFPTKAINTALQKGHLFSEREIKTLRRSCENVYNKLYDLRDQVYNAEKTFPKAFYAYYKRYWKLFKTCREYVRPSNITYNPEDHWFMEYVSAFANAQKNGYVYLCRSKTWTRNLNSALGKKLYNQSEELELCTTESLNLAFERAVNLMTGISSSGQKYRRYIQYDSGAKSLGRKIYNWVNVTGKVQSCSKKKDGKSVFPSDISWKPIINPDAKDKDVSVYIR